MLTIYSADWVLPIIAPRIENGAVAIDGTKIVFVGTRKEAAARYPEAHLEDFGDAAILPGLINTHSHLELTAMRGFLEAEEHDFFAWLRKLTSARMAMTDKDLLVSATCGAIEAARAGITCLGDSSSYAAQSMRAIEHVGLRAIVYQESFGPDPNHAAENVSKLRAQLDSMRALETDRILAGVSPHAPYTVSAPQLELISRLATDERLPLMMHAAESEAERLFLMKGEGAFTVGLQKRGIAWRAPGLSTIRYLDRHGVLDTKPLLAHCIHVDDADIDLINERHAGVAHCPKSNAKLRHGRAPFSRFILMGLNVGLGSDSVASNNTCDILEEARFGTLVARASEARQSENAHTDGAHALDRDPILPFPHDGASDTPTAVDALFAATLGGARALGLGDQIGSLAAGKQADLTVVALSGAHQKPFAAPEDVLIFSSSGRDVIVTMVAGREIYRGGSMITAATADFIHRLRPIRHKLDNVSDVT